ncbi:MAG: right-handed parallel beta-helix repeat-containing protein [Saprospiraceae bacterium]|nr:right-handed parallel beta-helix repeat-containing protein [Saprospiraceae bacterium]
MDFKKQGQTISFKVIILLILSGVFCSSCLKEPDYKSELSIRFSSDTLSFDTVFTTLGSTTLYIKIFNTSNEGIVLENLYLAGGSNSHFRLNLNGQTGRSFKNLQINSKDSIYLFCEVTIQPNDPLEISPFVILDSVIVENSGGTKTLILEAYGQNANYFPAKSHQRQVSGFDLEGATLVWNDPKPYVVYGVVFLDNGVLQIEAGTKIHFFGGLASYKNAEGGTVFYQDGRLIIGSNASIKVNGTQDNRVLITGARLEPIFQDLPGQWSGIALDKYSKGNTFKFADIRNSLQGLSMDSLSECEISNCVFSHQSFSGINALSAKLELNNCLFFDQGQQSISFQNGGQLQVAYTTFANFGNDESSVFVSNLYCADPPFCLDIRSNSLQAAFTNCIITGSNEDEFWMVRDELKLVPFNLSLVNCLFRSKELLSQRNYPDFITTYTEACILYQKTDSLFRKIEENDFRLDSLSVAENKAKPLSLLQLDLLGFPRDPVSPDLGCFEFEK